MIGPSETRGAQGGDGQEQPFLLAYRREVFGGGFFVSIGLGAAIGYAAAATKHGLDNALSVLTTEVLMGVGLLATILAALAFLATFFDQHFHDALREGEGGFLGAAVPFRIVAFSGAIAAAAGLASITLWDVFSHTFQASALGLVTAAAISAVIGTWNLVRDTTLQGLKREELFNRGH
jgi:hypothetical protein